MKLLRISGLVIDRDRETAEDNLDPETSARESVVEVSHDNIYNLPWHLGQEGLLCFLSQHTAWLTPLSEGEYKLEFTGRLLGGMWWGDSSDDSGGYSDNHDSESYSNGNYGRMVQCPSNFNLDSDGCWQTSDGRIIPNFNITEGTLIENSNAGSRDTRDLDFGRSYGKNSDGGSSSSDPSSSSDYGYTNSSSTNHHSRPATRKPAAAPKPPDLSKLFARLNIKPPAKPAPKPPAKPVPKVDPSKVLAAAKPPAKPAAKPAAPVAKPAVLKLPAQLTAKPVAKPAAPVAKPVPKIDLSKVLAAAKPAAKPAPKPAPKIDLSKVLAAAKPPAKPAAKPAAPVAKPAVLKLPAQLTAKPVAKPAALVAKPAPKTDLSKLLAVAKPAAKPAPVAKPVPKVDLSKLLAAAKPASKPAASPAKPAPKTDLFKSLAATKPAPVASGDSSPRESSTDIMHLFGQHLAKHPKESLENLNKTSVLLPFVGPATDYALGRATLAETAVNMVRDVNPLKRVEKAYKLANVTTKSVSRFLSQEHGSFSKKSNLTAKQREQIKDVPLIGQNPGNVAPHKKGGVKVDTELLGGDKAARQKFTQLTGESIPTGIKVHKKELSNSNLIVYREMGDSGHPKLEITRRTPQGIILEKISFK